MTNNDFKKGEEDALLGTTASRSTEDYVNGFFSGLRKTNPLFKNLDERAFREGYFSRDTGESHNSSYLAGQMVRKMAIAPSNLEKKVAKETRLKPAPRKAAEDPELDSINEERLENDLPPTSRQEIRERAAEYMDEKYGYDIDK